MVTVTVFLRFGTRTVTRAGIRSSDSDHSATDVGSGKPTGGSGPDDAHSTAGPNAACAGPSHVASRPASSVGATRASADVVRGDSTVGATGAASATARPRRPRLAVGASPTDPNAATAAGHARCAPRALVTGAAAATLPSSRPPIVGVALKIGHGVRWHVRTGAAAGPCTVARPGHTATERRPATTRQQSSRTCARRTCGQIEIPAHCSPPVSGCLCAHARVCVVVVAVMGGGQSACLCSHRLHLRRRQPSCGSCRRRFRRLLRTSYHHAPRQILWGFRDRRSAPVRRHQRPERC